MSSLAELEHAFKLENLSSGKRLAYNILQKGRWVAGGGAFACVFPAALGIFGLLDSHGEFRFNSDFFYAVGGIVGGAGLTASNIILDSTAEGMLEGVSPISPSVKKAYESIGQELTKQGYKDFRLNELVKNSPIYEISFNLADKIRRHEDVKYQFSIHLPRVRKTLEGEVILDTTDRYYRGCIGDVPSPLAEKKYSDYVFVRSNEEIPGFDFEFAKENFEKEQEKWKKEVEEWEKSRDRYEEITCYKCEGKGSVSNYVQDWKGNWEEVDSICSYCFGDKVISAERQWKEAREKISPVFLRQPKIPEGFEAKEIQREYPAREMLFFHY
ncbi:MAG: hypothetical protein ACP5OG_02540 [Candidatus Nanoarchaeia archaeon]